MGFDLTNTNIKDTYQKLTQISGSVITDGTGSLIDNLTITASNATSASYATTASFLEGGVSLQSVLDEGNTATGSISLDGDIDATNLELSGELRVAESIGFRDYQGEAITTNLAGQNFTINGGTAGSKVTIQGGAGSSKIVANSADDIIELSGSVESQDGITAPSFTGSIQGTDANFTTITGSNASFTSASIGYLQQVTGSEVIIGDEFIILNADTPTARYAGVKVYDSGSGTPATASLEWDGNTDNWIFMEESGNTAVILTGATGSRGSETLPTENTLQKGGGHHTLIDSSISDDGTLVDIDANVSASGYVSASEFIGDGSKLTGVDAFPYTGSAEITGSLGVTGDSWISGSLTMGDGGTHYHAINIQNQGKTPNSISTDGNSEGTIAIGWDNTTGKGADISIGQQNFGRDYANGVDNITIGKANIWGVGNATSENLCIGQSNTISGDGNNRIVIGKGLATTGGLRVVMLGGESNTAVGEGGMTLGGWTNVVTNTGGFWNAVINGNNNTLSSSGKNNTIVGGKSNTIDSATEESAILGGKNNTASHTGSVVLGGDGLSTSKDDEAVVPNLSVYGETTMSGSLEVTGSIQAIGNGIFGWEGNEANGSNSFVVGGMSGDINQANGAQSAVLGGHNNRVTGGEYGVILGGKDTTISQFYNGAIAGRSHNISGFYNVALGGYASTLSGNANAIVAGGSGGANSVSGTNSVCIGGYSNTISNKNHSIVSGRQNDVTGGQIQTIMGGLLNEISATEATNGIFTGKTATISGTSENSAIIGGVGADIVSHDRSVVLGGNNLATTKDDEVVVEHLNVQGQAIGAVSTITPASATGSMDCSAGNFFTMTLDNGTDVRLEASNITAGQTINLKLTNNATSAGTISFADEFEFEGGTAFTATATTSAVDVLTFISFDGTSLQAVGVKNFS
jgi:hypothetical protein